MLEGDVAELSDATPQPVDGTAATAGTGTKASRDDHVHALGPLVATLDFAAQEAKDMSLLTRADLPAYMPTSWKEGAIGFYTYDDHPYIYVV